MPLIVPDDLIPVVKKSLEIALDIAPAALGEAATDMLHIINEYEEA